ncbi:MAG: SDR family oxidoreductase [Pseudomonadota bacterium]
MSGKRTALVTGASAGLGEEFARQLAARDYNLVLVARRQDKLQSLAAQLQSTYGIHCQVAAADLNDPQAPHTLHGTLAEAGVEIDYLVNNAGSAGPDLLVDRDWQSHRDFYQLMMTSVAQLCHLFIPRMRERGFGRVVNVASVAARVPRADGCNYAPSKAYVVALSESLAATLKGTDVHVCALCPGFTHTDFHAAAGMMDMKNSLPKWLWYNADTVVRDGLKAAEKGKPICISGRLYRWVDPLFQSVWTRRLFTAPGRD